MQMTENELSEVISKFQMPEGRYSTNQKYLLMNTYSHHGVEAELECYREEGFDNLEAIPRRIETLEIPSDAEDEISKYLFGFYSIFEIKS